MHVHPAPRGVTFFFFNDTATTEIYTLSLHDALPISRSGHGQVTLVCGEADIGKSRLVAEAKAYAAAQDFLQLQDRKSTRLNSSHSQISYAVFCLKKKNVTIDSTILPAAAAGASNCGI